MPDVRLLEITKRYGDVVAADRVTIEIRDREYVTFLGPSGCGKTTILKIVAGILRQDEGDVYIGNRLVNDVPTEDRGVGYVFQNIVLFPHMNVWDNVTYGPRVRAWDLSKTRKLAQEMLEMVRLNVRSNAHPQELSGGMQQKTAVSRALTSGADLLLLDEPFASLDAHVRRELRQEVRRLIKDLGLTAIHVTHDQEEAMTISDRIVVMKKGRVLEEGKPRELYLKPATIFTANFLGEANFMEGKIANVHGGLSEVEVAGNLTMKVQNASFGVGESVVLAVRPEFVSVEKGERHGVNTMLGRITEIESMGWQVRREIRLDNENMVVSTAASDEAGRFSTGSRVTIKITPENLLLYSYPKEGLRAALALE